MRNEQQATHRILPLQTLLALCIALVAVSATAQSVDLRGVDRLVEQTLRAWQVPGAAIAIVHDDKVLLAKGYGLKEIDRSDPVTPDSLFGIASASKAFTSTALAILVDEKKVAWDDPVRKHVPYFRLSDGCADATVTIRDLLAHRTGLSRHDELWDNTSLTRQEVVRAAAHITASKPIRAAYQYNNIMFIAAGEAVAGAAGTTWEEFLTTRLFMPLGMTRSRLTAADFHAADHATGHRYQTATNTVEIHPFVDDSNLSAAGSIKSSARDMAQWIRFQLADGVIDGKRVVSAESLGETRTPQTVIRLEASSRELNPETNIQSYAMGWNVQDYRGEFLIAHGGALNGFRAQVSLLPARKAGVVVMINAGRGLAAIALRNALLDVIAGKPARDWNAYYLGIEQKQNERGETRKQERLAKRRPDARPSRELSAYAGSYRNAAYGDLGVVFEGDSLVMRWQRISAALEPFNYDTFRAHSESAGIDESLSFRLDETGEVRSLTMFGEEFVRQ